MLLSFFSHKGAPGATSSALVLAAVWPRDVVLVEADPAGGDLVYRCAAPRGTVLGENPSMLSMAAEVRRRSDNAHPAVHAQVLANGVNLVQGVQATQAAGVGVDLWSRLAAALRSDGPDVIVDLGRLWPHSPALAIARESDVLVPVASASLESVMHTTSNLTSLLPTVATTRRQRLRPLLIGADQTATNDCADHDAILERAGVVDATTSSLPLDGSALARLEAGERPDGRLGRTLLVRRAHRLAIHWAGSGDVDVVARAVPQRAAASDTAARWMVPRPEGVA